VTTKKRGRGFVWTVALGFASLLAAVIVLTQVGFYRDNLGDSTPIGWLPWLDLAYLTPIAVEGVAQVFTVMVAFAVINDRPSARYERLMWLFSAIAAGTNAWHNIHSGDWPTGVVLGGMSIAGPLIVHMTLRWDRDAQQDRTADEIRRAAIERALRTFRRGAQVTRHPIYSWKTVSIATNLGCSWDTAYRIALTGQYKAVHAVLVHQVEQSLPTVHKSELEGAQDGSAGVHTPVHDSEIERVHGPIGPDLFPACTDPLVAELEGVHDLGALQAIWAVHDGRARLETSNDDRAQDSAQEGVHGTVHGSNNESARRADDTVHGVHDEGAHGAREGVHGSAPKRAHGRARRSAQDRARPKSKRAQHADDSSAREVVHAHAERQEHIAARHWWECTNSGVDPRARTRQDVANELGINVTAVSRGFKMAESGEFPNPTGEA
jgi:hypothetical protein